MRLGRPWRDVVAPHEDIGSGRPFAADLAADLDADAFYSRTHLTAGLRALLQAAERRLAGGGGPPVLLLRTGFGGGKTHALLALRHRLRLAGTPVAVLTGTDLDPLARTLWGELAAQLGAYERVRAEDERGVPPPAPVLAELIGGAAVLLDELVAFLRPLQGSARLRAGTFDANLTFVHNLTEAARRSRRGLLVATLPASDAERGGPAGRAAAERLEAIFGRLETVWRPAASEEMPAIVRRRLFAAAEGDVDFPPYGQGVPAECREPGYRERMRAAYPFHPEVFERLSAGWTALVGFGGTRGVLRLLAAAVAELWRRGHAAPLILPGGLPLEAAAVRGELTRCLLPDWESVFDDVAGSEAGMARRVARALLLASAPAGRPGVELARLRLATVPPGEPVAACDDALAALRRRLGHLHADGGRLWLDPRPNLVRQARDRAAALPSDRVEGEVHRRLGDLARRYDRDVFGGAHAMRGEGDAPDDDVARLAVLPVGCGYDARRGEASAAVAFAARCLAARTRHGNMLVFLAPDAEDAPLVLDAAREYLAWADLDAAGVAEAERTLSARLRAAYRWVLAPAQDPGGPVRWEATRAAGDGDPVARAARRIREEHVVETRWSPAELALVLKRWLWRGGSEVAVDQVWADLTKYLYLPRLRDLSVLRDAIERADGELEHRDGLLVPTGAAVVATAAPGETPPSPTRFRGTVAVRGTADVARVTEEVLRHFAGVAGAEVTLTIEARAPGGLPADVMRVVRENAAALGFAAAEFDGGDERRR